MRIIVAPNKHKAEAAAKRRGLQPGRDCILVWDYETIQLTCLQDYLHPAIEVDPLSIPVDVRAQMSKYIDEVSLDPRKGFGWRNWTAPLDPDFRMM